MKIMILSLLIFNCALAQLINSENNRENLNFHNQWALDNSGQRFFRDSGEIYREEIKGTPGMDINLPSQEVLNQLGELDREVVVAVIDRGVDMHHPQLAGRLYKGVDFLTGDDVHDDQGHGTHVAGIIAANGTNGGVRGITPRNVKILPLKVLSDAVEGFLFTRRTRRGTQRILITDIIANAINYAISAKVDVINMSLGWPKSINTPRVTKALDEAAKKGILIVAASGNNNKNVPLWPCAHRSVVCVGAMDNQGEISEFSNHGAKVDLVASGEWIVSTFPTSLESRTLRIGGQEVKNGSSQAAPFVAGAAALLKLKYPAITNDEIKATLFKSAAKVAPQKDGLTHKFVRYGRLDINKALEMGPESLIDVNIKDLVSVKVNTNGEYNFQIPINFYGTDAQSFSARIHDLPGAEISYTTDSIIVTGVLNNLNQDSELNTQLEITANGETYSTSLTLSFTTVLEASQQLTKVINNYPANRLLRINGEQKAHALGEVSIEDSRTDDLLLYTTQTNKDEKTIETFLFKGQINTKNINTQKFILENHSVLLAVFKKDINLDGKSDYMFYGLGADRKKLILTFFNENGTPLFSDNSTWVLPISRFEGLPLKEKELSDFSWIKANTSFGKLALPYFKKRWSMPAEDNGFDLLDFDTAHRKHFFYLKPELKNGVVTITPRVFDSISIMNKINKELNPGDYHKVDIQDIIPQTEAEKQKGEVRHFVTVGDEFFKKYYILKANEIGEYSIIKHINQDPFQIGNMFIAARDYKNFAITESAYQFALIDRAKARVGIFGHNNTDPAWTLETSGWSNPFFQVIGSFHNDQKKTLFFETRYHVYVYDKNQNEDITIHKLPINRDSSFPGVEFSETIKPVIVNHQGLSSSAIAVDSSLIYGDRLYTMLKTSDAFIRPISLSVHIPANCTPLKTRYIPSINSSAYVLVCQEEGNQASIQFVPLKIK